jgi:hypothetical protein
LLAGGYSAAIGSSRVAIGRCQVDVWMSDPPGSQVEGDLPSRLFIGEKTGGRPDLDCVVAHALDRTAAPVKPCDEVVEKVGFADPDAHCRR